MAAQAKPAGGNVRKELPLTQRAVKIVRWFSGLIVGGFFVGLALQQVADYDVWWHLRTGQLIAENFSLPAADSLSFSTTGAPWLVPYWLSDPLYYLIVKQFGIEGLQWLVALVVAAAGVSLYLFLLGCGLPSLAAAGLSVWAGGLARFRFMLRPLVFKFAGVVFLFWIFFRRPTFRHRHLLFFLVVLIWNGLYPGAFLAQVMAVLAVIEAALERWTGSPRYLPGALRETLLLLLLASLALLMNPYGLSLYKVVYGGMFADYGAGLNLVEEHQSLLWSEHPGFAALVLVAAFTFWLGRRRIRPLAVMAFLAFLCLAWGSVRYVGLASFAMAGIAGVNLQENLSGWRRSWRMPVASGWLQGAGILLLAGGCLLFWQTTYRSGKTYAFGLGVNQSRYPFAAVRQLEALNFRGNIYNSWRFGGFLAWQLPESKIFIDGRCLPAQLALFEQFRTLPLHEFSRYLAGHEVGAAVIDRQELRDIDYFKAMPGFSLVQADDLSVLFVRNDLLREQGPATSRSFRYLRVGGYDYEYLAPLARGAEAAAVEGELLAAVAAAPESFFENFQLAYFYDVRNDPRAARQYLLAAGKNPGFAFTHFQAGSMAARAALKAGQWEIAAEGAGAALDYQKTGELYFLLGAARQKLGETERAESAYRESLKLADNGRVRNNLGFLLLDARRFDEALSAFDKSLGRHDDPVAREQALYGKSLALRALKRPAEAQQAVERLRTDYPSSSYLQGSGVR